MASFQGQICVLEKNPRPLYPLPSHDLMLINRLVEESILSIWTALYLIGLCAIPFVIWKARRTSTIFTVFLGCILTALLTANYCLWMELRRYHFDLKAQEAKQRVGLLKLEGPARSLDPSAWQCFAQEG